MLNPWVAGILSFLHVISAVVAVGGTFFLHVVLGRVAAQGGGVPPELKATLARRWTRVVWHALATLVVTGSITLWSAMARHVYGPKQQILFGIKMVFVLGLIVVVTLLTVNTPWVQQRRSRLLTINVVVGILIVLMSTLLRRSY